MKITTLSLIAVISAFSASAQQDTIAMKYARNISPALAELHLSIIASDAYEGRETGKPGADKAAHYIATEFKAQGLEAPVNGSYFFNVPLETKDVNMSVNINARQFTNAQDYYAANVYEDRKLITPEIVFIGYGTNAEIANVDLKGKVVLMINEDKPQPGVKANTGFRMSKSRLQIVKNLQEKGVALIMATNAQLGEVLKTNGARLRAGRLTIKQDKGEVAKPQAAVLLITSGMADELVKSTGRTFDGLKGTVTDNFKAQTIAAGVAFDYHTTMKDVKAVDVVGLLPGSDPKLKDEVLVISAHYDHIGVLPEGTPGDRINNGADDDGSGTTAIMELARAFSRARDEGHGPRRSILFLGNVGEEKGLLGSEYYTDHPTIPLANTIADLNIDMIGRIGADYIGKPDSANNVYVIGSSMLSTDLHKANEKANTLYTHLDLDYKYDDPNDPNSFYTRSDHYNFAKHGVPIIFYFNGVHKDYHQPGDEIGKINFPLLTKRAQLVFYTAWDLANADARPVVDGKK